MKKRILFLMSDTGGGHRAAAQAVSEAIHYRYPGQFSTIIEDVWKDYTPWPISALASCYGWLISKGLVLWKILWYGSARFRIDKLMFTSLLPILKQRLTLYFNTIEPDIVISVHPLMNHLGLQLMRNARLAVPFITIITDLISFHPAWIYPEVTRCIVPTKSAQRSAIRLGMPPEKIDVCGQPLRLNFVHMNHNQRAVRKKLQLCEYRPVVMLMHGGEGAHCVLNIAQAIERSVPHAQLIIVAGRNQDLVIKLESVSWKTPVQVYGFVENVHELMVASSLLITKAGPNTISEACMAGLPMIISSHIPGQETDNVVFVKDQHIGVYAEAPTEIAVIAANLLAPNNKQLAIMAQNALRLARPSASLDIATKICELL